MSVCERCKKGKYKYRTGLICKLVLRESDPRCTQLHEGGIIIGGKK